MKNIMLPAPYKILSVTKETKAEYTFRVACDANCDHGQFFQLSIPKIGEAPISVSAKGTSGNISWLEFTIRKVGQLTKGVFGLMPGDTIFMRGPYGNTFPLDTFKGKPVAIITGGTGLAAVRSMLHDFEADSQKASPVYLIAGFTDIDSVLFTDDLKRFEKCFNTIYTLDNKSIGGYETGLVTEHIEKIPFKSLEDCNVVIVGPPIMITKAAEKCLAIGVCPENIWTSIERKMACAVGKCGHCKINDTYVCLEGPIFNYTQAQKLLD
jgi:anaerobic sulfite reductase subunit B